MKVRYLVGFDGDWPYRSLAGRASEVRNLARSNVGDPVALELIELLADIVEDLAIAEADRRKREQQP